MPADVIEAFIAHLQRHATATAALAAWCAPRMGAGPGRIVARVLQDAPVNREAESLRHRRVQLLWGATAVSDAENWYLPDRLPEAVQKILLAGDIPFGAAIAALKPERRITSLAQSPGGRHFLHITATVSIGGREVAEVAEHYCPVLLTTLLAAPLLVAVSKRIV